MYSGPSAVVSPGGDGSGRGEYMRGRGVCQLSIYRNRQWMVGLLESDNKQGGSRR
jgi:hypothetical protein